MQSQHGIPRRSKLFMHPRLGFATSIEFGEGARCCRLVPRSLRSYRIQDSRLQQVEFGPTEHLSLDIFEPIYLSLCLTVTPQRGKGFLNGSVIAADSREKTFERIACCCRLCCDIHLPVISVNG